PLQLMKTHAAMIRRGGGPPGNTSERLGLTIPAGQILEAGVLGEKRDLELAGRAIPLLADVDLGRLARLLLHGVLAVEGGPVQEHDDVGVLLQRAALPQVAQTRRVVAPGL